MSFRVLKWILFESHELWDIVENEFIDLLDLDDEENEEDEKGKE